MCFIDLFLISISDLVSSNGNDQSPLQEAQEHLKVTLNKRAKLKSVPLPTDFFPEKKSLGPGTRKPSTRLSPGQTKPAKSKKAGADESNAQEPVSPGASSEAELVTVVSAQLVHAGARHEESGARSPDKAKQDKKQGQKKS